MSNYPRLDSTGLNTMLGSLADNVIGDISSLQTTTKSNLVAAINELAQTGGAADMTGATASAAGAHGLAPAPAAGAQNYVLTGGGVYVNPNTLITKDSTPISGSTNALTSGGAYTALINKLATAVAGDKYSSSTTYEVGEYCIDDDVLYKCLTRGAGHTPASSSTYWKATSISDELSALNSNSTSEDLVFYNLNITTTSKTYSTYNNVKFSDYKFFIGQLWYVTNNVLNGIRATFNVNYSSLCMKKNISIYSFGGSTSSSISTYYMSGATICMASDTTLTAATFGNSAFTGLMIYGYK